MVKYRRSKADISAEIMEQRQALNASVLNYDSGATWEAKRIATALYTLLFDGTGRTKSLIGQAGIAHRAQFLNTAQPTVTEAFPLGLLIVNATQRRFIPISSEHGFHDGDGIPPWGGFVPFSQWWTQPIFFDPKRGSLTRKQLVFAVRSQDGGAHYDQFLRSDPYLELVNYDGDAVVKLLKVAIQSNSSEEVQRVLSSVTRLSDARNSSIRQIAFEVEASFHEMDTQGLL